jgi:hypothetical protein
MAKRIIAVGYQLTFVQDLEQRIAAGLAAADRDVNLEDYDITHSVLSGVLYDKSCKGRLDDVRATPEEMLMWYNRRKGKTYTAIVRSIYVVERPNVIIASVSVQSTNLFVFISKTSDKMQTTHFKRMVNRGLCGKPLPIEPFNIEATAYIYPA